MEHPEFLAKLHRIDHAKGITLEPQCDLKHAGARVLGVGEGAAIWVTLENLVPRRARRLFVGRLAFADAAITPLALLVFQQGFE